MAMPDSVTVSMLELTIGIFSFIPVDNCVDVSTSFLEEIEDFFGTSRTSSNVNPLSIIVTMVFPPLIRELKFI